MDSLILKLLTIFAKTIAPESLLLVPKRKKKIPPSFESIEKSKLLQIGDIILTSTPARVYDYLRTLANTSYDHAVKHCIAVVIEKGKVLHVSYPKIRVLDVEILCEKKRTPIILRPNISPSEREEFLKIINSKIGMPYDSKKSMKMLIKALLAQNLQIKRKLKNYESYNGAICTEVILHGLLNSSYSFQKAIFKIKNSLDLNNYGVVTLNDFLKIAILDNFFTLIPLYEEKVQNSHIQKEIVHLRNKNIFPSYLQPQLETFYKSQNFPDSTLNQILLFLKLSQTASSLARIISFFLKLGEYLFFIQKHRKNKNPIYDLQELGSNLLQLAYYLITQDLRSAAKCLFKILILLKKFNILSKKESSMKGFHLTIKIILEQMFGLMNPFSKL